MIMWKRWIIMILLAGLIAGCSSDGDHAGEHTNHQEDGQVEPAPGSGDSGNDEPVPGPAPDETNADDPDPDDSQSGQDAIKIKMNAMSFEEKIGQMLLAGFEGTTMNENTMKMIKEGYIGGVIVYK